MRKINILFLDWRLSRSIIENALSCELNSSILNLDYLIKEQLRNNESLGKEITNSLRNGEVLTTEIIGKIISRNLKEINGNLLLIEYPRTLKQFGKLKELFVSENIELENIWYFKQREPKEFMNSHFQNPKERKWFDKFGIEVIEKWEKEFNSRRQQITEIRRASDEIKWKIVEMDYRENLTSEYLTKRIKDCA